MVSPLDPAFIFRLCCTEHYILAPLKDLDGFAWNNVKDKLASFDLRLSSCAILMGGELVV